MYFLNLGVKGLIISPIKCSTCPLPYPRRCSPTGLSAAIPLAVTTRRTSQMTEQQIPQQTQARSIVHPRQQVSYQCTPLVWKRVEQAKPRHQNRARFPLDTPTDCVCLSCHQCPDHCLEPLDSTVQDAGRFTGDWRFEQGSESGQGAQHNRPLVVGDRVLEDAAQQSQVPGVQDSVLVRQPLEISGGVVFKRLAQKCNLGGDTWHSLGDIVTWGTEDVCLRKKSLY